MGKSAKRRGGTDKKRRQKRAARRPELARMPGPAPLVGAAPGDAHAVVLDRLWSVVLMRRDADPAVSHSARLLANGIAKVAQKFGEEAVECLIEGVAGNRTGVIAESADVLYHLIVLWVAGGIRPEEVWAELIRREGMSGIAEKRARAMGALTRKIP